MQTGCAQSWWNHVSLGHRRNPGGRTSGRFLVSLWNWNAGSELGSLEKSGWVSAFPFAWLLKVCRILQKKIVCTKPSCSIWLWPWLRGCQKVFARVFLQCMQKRFLHAVLIVGLFELVNWRVMGGINRVTQHRSSSINLAFLWRIKVNKTQSVWITWVSVELICTTTPLLLNCRGNFPSIPHPHLPAQFNIPNKPLFKS